MGTPGRNGHLFRPLVKNQRVGGGNSKPDNLIRTAPDSERSQSHHEHVCRLAILFRENAKQQMLNPQKRSLARRSLGLGTLKCQRSRPTKRHAFVNYALPC
jgi:hypothetical protein